MACPTSAFIWASSAGVGGRAKEPPIALRRTLLWPMSVATLTAALVRSIPRKNRATSSVELPQLPATTVVTPHAHEVFRKRSGGDFIGVRMDVNESGGDD